MNNEVVKPKFKYQFKLEKTEKKLFDLRKNYQTETKRLKRKAKWWERKYAKLLERRTPKGIERF